jgi:hypothetical protein
MKTFPPISPEGLRTTRLADRKSKVGVQEFAKAPAPDASFRRFWDGLPDILGARDLRDVAARIVRARRGGHVIHWAIGAHVVKVGLAPVLLELMSRGYLSALSVNGAVLVHDTEVALAGKTSEDVDASLGDGSFGVTLETAQFINEAAREAATSGIGLGEAVGRKILASGGPHVDLSVLAAAVRNGLPVTAHVALGTDVIHLHPSADGAAIGAATLQDFRQFAGVTAELQHGVYLNVGSAVLLPEVFLKALTLVRNLGRVIDDFTAVNMDFVRHYRPITNVVTRPTGGGGKGFHLTGQHELMVPLLAQGILATEASLEG